MIANSLVALVALIHVYIVVLEMAFWDKPLGRRTFGTTAEFAAASKVLAANQGLYNGFLVAGLIWGIWLGDAGDTVKIFFLLCVAVAGAYGALTVGVRILLIQTSGAGGARRRDPDLSEQGRLPPRRESPRISRRGGAWRGSPCGTFQSAVRSV